MIAGYVLTHAAYSLSDLEDDELLVPFAVTQSGDSQELIRFEADTQEGAITKAKLKLEQIQESVDIYGFAREGMMRTEDGAEIDVISIDSWEQGQKFKFTVIQPFKPNKGNGEFRILPGVEFVINGESLDEDIEKQYAEILAEGISYHPVGDSWAQWTA